MEKLEYLKSFCQKNNLVLETRGECGFGRPCVGIIADGMDNYVDYNPTDCVNYDFIPNTFSDKHFEIAPEDAYHKHSCFAVLAHNDDYDTAIGQLYEWIKKVEEIGYEVKEYATGATGLQAMVSGTKGTCIVLK